MPGKGWVRSLFQRPEMDENLKREFRRADSSGDGRLDVQELHKALMVVMWQLKQAGMFHDGMTVTYERTYEIFRNFDKNGDGHVDFLEFKDIAAHLLTEPFQRKEMVEGFVKSVIDHMLAKGEGEDASRISALFQEVGGALDVHTLSAILKELHVGFQYQGFIDPRIDFNKSKVQMILVKHDTDGSGVIEEDEFTPILEDFLFSTFFIPA